MISAEESAGLRLFDGVEVGVLQRIAEQVADIRLAAGEYAANEDERARFFVVFSGRLELTHRVGAAECQLVQLERSDTFDDISLLIGSGRSCKVIAPSPKCIGV